MITVKGRTSGFAKLVALTYSLLCTIGAPQNASAAELPYGYDRTELVELYERLALGPSELEPADAIKSDRLIQKRAPKRAVEVAILPQQSVPVDQTIASAALVIDEITERSPGLAVHVLSSEELIEFTRRNAGRQPDLTDYLLVFIGSRQELLDSIGKHATGKQAVSPLYDRALALGKQVPVCFAITTSAGGGAGYIGYAAAWVESGSSMNECLYEEVMHSFGLVGSFPPGVPSIFSSDRLYRSPTDLDWALWRIHEDGRIVAGMRGSDAREVANIVVGEMERSENGQ